MELLGNEQQMQTAMQGLQDPQRRLQLAQTLARRFPAPPRNMFPSARGTGQTMLDQSGIARAQIQNAPVSVAPQTPGLRTAPTVDLNAALQFAQSLQQAPGRAPVTSGVEDTVQVATPQGQTPQILDVGAPPPQAGVPNVPAAQPVAATPAQTLPPDVLTTQPVPIEPPQVQAPAPVAPEIPAPVVAAPPAPVVVPPQVITPTPLDTVGQVTVAPEVQVPSVEAGGSTHAQGNNILSHPYILGEARRADNFATPGINLFDGIIGEGGNLRRESRVFATSNGVFYDQNNQVITRAQIPSSGMVPLPGLNRNGNPMFLDSAGNILKKQQSGGGYDRMGNIRDMGETPTEVNGVTARGYTPEAPTEADRSFGRTVPQVGSQQPVNPNVVQPGAFNPEIRPTPAATPAPAVAPTFSPPAASAPPPPPQTVSTPFGNFTIPNLAGGSGIGIPPGNVPPAGQFISLDQARAAPPPPVQAPPVQNSQAPNFPGMTPEMLAQIQRIQSGNYNFLSGI